MDAFSHAEITHPDVKSIKAYFGGDDDSDARIRQINRFLEELRTRHPGSQFQKPHIRTVNSEDWSSNWKAHFKPLLVGKRLLITPTWETAPDDPGLIVLRLDPGMAFGTGGHETTRLCLELLEEVMTGAADARGSVLDLGTGSGILAMAAVRLGASMVRAVDIDPLAIEVTLENLAINDLRGRVECDTTPLESLTGTFDVILANILAEELVRLAPHLNRCLNPGGRLVLSGILAEKESYVRNGFSTSGLRFLETRADGEWVAILYEKTA